MDIARASHSCLRCRRQKKRCNRGIPKCSHCLRANAACRRETFISGSHVPVRTVSELEAEVARLETQIAAGAGAGRLHPDRTPVTPGWTEDETRGTGNTRRIDETRDAADTRNTDDDAPELGPGLSTSREGQEPNLSVLADLNNATVYDYENYNLTRMLTNALMLGNDALDMHSGKQLRRPLSLLNSPRDDRSPIHHLPKDLLFFYLERYFEHVNPTFPILAVGDVTATLQCLDNGEIADPSEACILYLVLAIGAVFPSTDSLLDAGIACQLWLVASNEQVFHDESDDTIRILFLLVLFSLLEEGCGSSWHLVELLIRSCIKLGLHSKASEQTSSTENIPLFWSAYLLDRWISYTLGLPVSIHNEEFDLEIPDLPPGSGQQSSPVSLWHMAYGLSESSGGPSNTLREQAFPSAGFLQSMFSHSSKLMYNMIAVDLRVAHAARCILREGGTAAQRFDDIALDHLSAVEAAIKRGSTLSWTSGYTTFVSIMIRLISFGQPSRCHLLFAQSVPDPAYISRAVDVLRGIGRTFKALGCLGDVLEHLHQIGTSFASDPIQITIGVPRHSKVFAITSCALQSIGVSLG